MKPINCQLVVIGAGPGGYVCAVRAGRLGLDTVIVEAQSPGGTCLNIGCIPSKALIHAAEEYDKVSTYTAEAGGLGIRVEKPAIDLSATMAWKDGIVGRLNSGVAALLKKAKVKTVKGWARFLDGKTLSVRTETGDQVIHAENVVIATGSAPVALPSLPFGGPVISSTEALALAEVPKSLVVVGAGYIGLELGMAFARMGTRLTVVEALPGILAQYDAELVRPVLKRLDVLRADVLLGAKAKGLSNDAASLLVGTAEGEERTISSDRILVAVGRRPRLDNCGIEELALDFDGPFIRIDEHCRTAMRGIYAIGDVTGEPMLAHRAIAQGEMVAEIVAGHDRVWDKRVIPAICFTDPEIVTAGLSPEEARSQGRQVVVGRFPFTANGRAMTRKGELGLVRVVARADNHLVLGIQAVGQGVSELSAAFGLAVELGARLEDIAGTIHAHPTLGEAFQEAALSGLGQALHQ